MSAIISIFGQVEDVRRDNGTLRFTLSTTTGAFEVFAERAHAESVCLAAKRRHNIHIIGALHMTSGGQEHIRLLAISVDQPSQNHHPHLLAAAAALHRKRYPVRSRLR